jgi:hypothetical protein
MGLCMSKDRSNIEPSVPTPKAQPPPQRPQPPPIPDGTTSTPPRKPSTPMTRSERTRAQSQVEGTAFSQRRHDNGRDYYPPPSSGGGVFTSQHPDRQELRRRGSSSSGKGHTERNRSMSDAAALRSAPSRRHRTASTGRQGGRSRFLFALQSLLPNDFRYVFGHYPIKL